MIEQKTELRRSEELLEDQYESIGKTAESQVSLLGVLIQFARRKWLIAYVTGFAGLCGIVISLALPVRYTAVTKIMTPRQSQSAASLLMSEISNSNLGSLANVAGGGLGLKNPNDLYIGLLNSRTVADAIIEKFELAKVYRAKNMLIARKKLADNTKVVSERSGLLAISVEDKDRNRAAEMANAYTDGLRVLTKTLAVTEASQRRLFYEEQLKSAKDGLVSAELALQQIQQKKGLVVLDAQAKALVEGIAVLHAEISTKQVELQAKRSYSTEQNPEVQLLEGQLASMKVEASRLEQRSKTSGAGNLGLQDLAGSGLEYLQAEHEVKYRQVMFDMLLRQFDAAKLDEAKDAAVIQIVEPAIPPDQKSSPRRAMIVLMFTVLGLLCGISYVFVHDLSSRNPATLESLAEFKSALFAKTSSGARSMN